MKHYFLTPALFAAALPALFTTPTPAVPGPLLDKPEAAEADRLFDRIFPDGEQKRKEYWDADARALCSSGYGHNEKGLNTYIENIRLLSADGMELRTYSRMRFTNDANKRWCNHTCKVEKAVYPFLFAEPLRLIVDRNEECIFFHHWQMDAANRELLRVQVKNFNLDKAEVVSEYTDFEVKGKR